MTNSGSMHIISGLQHLKRMSATERVMLESIGARLGARGVMASERASGDIGFVFKDARGLVVGRARRSTLAQSLTEDRV